MGAVAVRRVKKKAAVPRTCVVFGFRLSPKNERKTFSRTRSGLSRGNAANPLLASGGPRGGACLPRGFFRRALADPRPAADPGTAPRPSSPTPSMVAMCTSRAKASWWTLRSAE